MKYQGKRYYSEEVLREREIRAVEEVLGAMREQGVIEEVVERYYREKYIDGETEGVEDAKEN